MKISDILEEQEISSKYLKCEKYENKEIIKKIYEDKKELNVIKILELTFEELFIIFRRKLKKADDLKKLEEIKDKIEGLDLSEKFGEERDIIFLIKDIENKNKEKMEKNELEEYIEKIKKLCLTYEEWFNKKIERCRNKKKQKII